MAEDAAVPLVDEGEGLPSPGEVAQKFLDTDPGEGEGAAPAAAPPAAAAPAPPADEFRLSKEEYEALKRSVETANKRQEDTRAEYQRERAAREALQQEAQRRAQVEEQKRARDEWLRKMARPAIGEVEKFHDDPAAIAKAIEEQTEWAYNRALAEARAESMPYFERMQWLEGQLQRLQTEAETSSSVSRSTAAKEARELVAKEGYDDFDEALPEIRSTLEQNGLGAALLSPTQLAQAYFLHRFNAGKGMAAPEKKTPPNLPRANGSVKSRSDTVDPAVQARITPMLAEMNRVFGDNWKPTAEDLREAGFTTP